MKKMSVSLFAIGISFLSGGFLLAQNPTTIVCQGTLTDIEGELIAGEECLVTIIIADSDDEVLFKHESTLSTGENGSFLFVAETLPSIFSENWTKELVNFEISIKSPNKASWLEGDEFTVKYHFEKNKEDDFGMTRYEGQSLDVSVMKPVWEFSDQYAFGYLSSVFMISFSDEISDAESILTICKMMHEESEPAPPPTPAPAPSERGVKGGYAVGGYKK